MTTTTITGTTGNDILNAPGSVTALVAGLSGSDTITLAVVADQAQAGAGDDSITLSNGGAVVNTVSGGSGNDTIYALTGATTLGGVLGLNDGDDVFLNTNNVQLVAASVGGNAGSDTLTFGTGGILNSTIGGGSQADSIAITAGTITNSAVIGGGGADSVLLDGTFSLSTIQSADGHDRINATGLSGSATLVIASGKGYDSIALGTATIVATVAAGSGNDTIVMGNNADGGFGGGVIFGDGVGVTTGNDASGTDSIGSTRIEITGATSVYGGGKADTIMFNSLSANGVLSGGMGADLIGNSALDLNATSILIDGGAGQDTIELFSSNSVGASIFGGAGLDSINFFGTGDATVNGGTGNDTINYAIPGAISTAAAGLATINGAGGSDQILLGSWTAGTYLATAVAGTVSNLTAAAASVVVGSGDSLFFATTATTTQANWEVNNQIAVLSAASSGLTAYSAGSGNISVYVSDDDLVIAISAADGAGLSDDTIYTQLVNVVGGATLVNTTLGGTAAGGNLVINSTNFGFTVAGSDTGLTISFT